jgi:hypothetical protein
MSDEQQTAFADQMWDTVANPSPQVGPSVLGFMMCDPSTAQFDSAFTTRLADTATAYEEKTGQPLMDGSDLFGQGVTGWPAKSQSGYSPYGQHAGSSPYNPNDPDSCIMAQLGGNPDAALKFLEDPSNVDHWFKRPADTDGMAGASALWKGALQADGGIGSATYNKDVWEEQETIDKEVYTDLDARIQNAYNESGSKAPDVADMWSEQAKQNLAQAIGMQMPEFAYTTVVSETSEQTVSLPWADGSYPFYAPNDDTLSRLIGIAGNSPIGVGIMEGAASTAEEEIIDAGLRQGSQKEKDALESATKLQGYVDGAISAGIDNSSAEGDIQRQDYLNKVKGGIETGLGLIPGVGAATDAGKLLSKFADIGINKVEDTGLDKLLGIHGTRMGDTDATAKMKKEEDSMRQAWEDRLGALKDDYDSFNDDYNKAWLDSHGMGNPSQDK